MQILIGIIIGMAVMLNSTVYSLFQTVIELIKTNMKGQKRRQETVKCKTKDCPVEVSAKYSKGFCRFCAQRNRNKR